MEGFKILNAEKVEGRDRTRDWVKVSFLKANGQEKEKIVRINKKKNGSYLFYLDSTKVFCKSNDGKIFTNFYAQFSEVIGTKTNEEGTTKIAKKVFGKVKHPKYDMIKTCIQQNIPVYLAGPAGAGKNYTLEQIANENGYEFYFMNSIQDEFKITGFIDANGTYQETEFYKACKSENESIFFLDEIDASTPEVLVMLNAAIANGYFNFPNGRIDFGKDKVHFVAAGNTVGNGANDMYTGRQQLDQASLDRFAIIEFDYSKNVEKQITNNNEELIDFVRQLRKVANQNFIKTTFSYRCMEMVTSLEKTSMDLDDILKIAVFKGLDQDTINTFKFDSTWEYNKYAICFNKSICQ